MTSRRGGDPPVLRWTWLGRRPYDEVWGLQIEARDRLLGGGDEDVLFLCEHDPVVTLGRRADPGSLLVPEAELEARGTAVRRIERGGDATWHGPGQLVGYPVVRLRPFGLDVPGFVGALEEAMIGFLSARGLDAGRRPGYPGAWVAGAKCGAVGVHFRRFVSLHGFALNLSNDPGDFAPIVPCGIRDAGVASLHSLVGASPSPAEAAEEMAIRVAEALGGRPAPRVTPPA